MFYFQDGITHFSFSVFILSLSFILGTIFSAISSNQILTTGLTIFLSSSTGSTDKSQSKSACNHLIQFNKFSKSLCVKLNSSQLISS
jgi:hypothetical protein